MFNVYLSIWYTRSYAALPAADLDWIVGPGYSLGGYILEKNHENQPKPEKPWKTNLEPWKTMKNQPETMKTIKTMKTDQKNQPGTIKTMKTNLEPWKTKPGTSKNHETDQELWKLT